LNPAIRNWKDYPEEKKNKMWDEYLIKNFRFLKGTHALVKHRALQMMGQSFRRWRSELNIKYIQKGLTPYNEYGNITPTQWVFLIDEKTSEAAKAISAKNREQAKKNQHHPRLGPGGYEAKEQQFSKMHVEAEASRNTAVMKLKPHIRHWIYARSVDQSDSSLKFAKSETTDAVSRILKYVEDKEKGTFTSSRERDELSLGLRNHEHIGHVRGLGKLTT
jgi:hypothetical protein